MVNLLRKWTHYCFSLDFLGNAAQVGYNGIALEKIINLKTVPQFENQLGGPKVLENGPDSKFLLKLGRYFFDDSRVFANIAGIQIWNRTLSGTEIEDLSSCDPISNRSHEHLWKNWTFPKTDFIKEVSFEIEVLQCTKKMKEILVPMPIPPMSKTDAVNICNKFGNGAGMAGEFRDESEFHHFYSTLQNSTRFNDVCGYANGGRLKTWLPYTVRKDSKIIHDTTGEELDLAYYTSFFPGPNGKGYEEKPCLAGYFGKMLTYKMNIDSDYCHDGLRCVVCKISNSLEQTTLVKLRGVCKFSAFDDSFQVKLTEEGDLKYFGLERTVIFYNKSALAWQMSDVINPNIRAIFKSGFRSLGLGTQMWRISDDIKCQEGDILTSLSLTTCNETQFTCSDGLCVNLEDRYLELMVHSKITHIPIIHMPTTHMPHATCPNRSPPSNTPHVYVAKIRL